MLFSRFEIEPNLVEGLLSSSVGGGGIRSDPLEVKEDERLKLGKLGEYAKRRPNAGGSSPLLQN